MLRDSRVQKNISDFPLFCQRHLQYTMLLQLSVLVLISSVILYNVPRLFEPRLLPIVEGFFQPEFMEVALALRKNMESGKEQGASFAVYHEGELVIDMWAGYADKYSYRRWRNETTTLAFGCTKGVMAFLVALMVDRGLLNYSKPIAEYWPEFGMNGKMGITLEMFLNHQAGIPFLEEAISLRDLELDIQHVEKCLLAQQPVWHPGTLHGYHDWTFGIILDRLVQGQDPKHRTVPEIFTEEIAKPLDIDFDVNLKEIDVHRTARIFPPSFLQAAYQSITNLPYLKMYLKYFFSSDSLAQKSASIFNDPEIRQIGLSSYSGTGTARGLSKLFSILANGGEYEGNRILEKQTVEKMTHPATNETCSVTELPMQFSNGMQIFTNPNGETTFGHSGYGGQVVIADLTNKLSIAYLTNYLSVYQNGDDPRFLELQKGVYKNLHKYIERKEKMNRT